MPKQGSFVQRPNVAPKWNPPAACAAAISVFLFCLWTAVAVKGQQSAAPAAAANRAVLTGVSLTEFASLDPIDSHGHVFQTGPEFVGMMERLHMHILDIMVVDDTSPYRASTEPEKSDALKFIASSKGHASLCTTFDAFLFNKPDFAQKTIDALNRDFARGAVAIKIWKNVGMEIKNATGQYILPDDPGLTPIYKDIAAHNKTLIAETSGLRAAG
jgi:hypothetical protein